MSLSDFTIEKAKALEGETFDVALPDGRVVQMSLDQALPYEQRQRRPARGASLPTRAPFSLYFLGPPDEVIAQGMYEFRHPQTPLGSVFIVPTGQDAAAVEYEAVFT